MKKNNDFICETENTVFKCSFGEVNIKTGDSIYEQSKCIYPIDKKFTIEDIINFVKGLPWKYNGKRS